MTAALDVVVLERWDDRTMSSDDHHALLAAGRLGVLATVKASGLPQLSPVQPFYDRRAGELHVSMTEGRAKTANLRRDPWAALHLDHPDFWSYAVLEGGVTLSDVAARPDDDAVEELVGLYRALQGEHDDWDDYRATMVRDRRLVVRLRPTYAYGALRG